MFLRTGTHARKRTRTHQDACTQFGMNLDRSQEMLSGFTAALRKIKSGDPCGALEAILHRPGMLRTLSNLSDGEGSKAVLALLRTVLHSEAALASSEALQSVFDEGSDVAAALETVLGLGFEEFPDLTTFFNHVAILSKATTEGGMTVIGALAAAIGPAAAAAALVAVSEILPHPASLTLSAAATAALNISRTENTENSTMTLQHSTRSCNVPQGLAPLTVTNSKIEKSEESWQSQIPLNTNSPSVFVLPVRCSATRFIAEPASLMSPEPGGNNSGAAIDFSAARLSSPSVRFLHPALRLNRQSVASSFQTDAASDSSIEQANVTALTKSSAAKYSFVMPIYGECTTSPAAEEGGKDYGPSRAEPVSHILMGRFHGFGVRSSPSPQPIDHRQSLSNSADSAPQRRYFSHFVRGNNDHIASRAREMSELNPIFISPTKNDGSGQAVLATAEFVTATNVDNSSPGWISSHGAASEYPKQSQSEQVTPMLLWPNRLRSLSPTSQGNGNQLGRSWRTPAMIFSTLLAPTIQQPRYLDPSPAVANGTNTLPAQDDNGVTCEKSLTYGDCGSDNNKFQKIIVSIVVALGPQVAARAAELLYEVLPMPAQVEHSMIQNFLKYVHACVRVCACVRACARACVCVWPFLCGSIHASSRRVKSYLV